ncbi:MAG: chemotaxis protein methyltransferase CheR, partial [bacterium]
SNNEFLIWQLLIEERCGLYFRPNKSEYLSSKLWQRTKLLGIETYNNYYNYIVFNPGGKQEWEKLVELLVINETSFFRHSSSFDALANSIVPKLLKDTSKIRTSIKVWSAGCATGEEAYSLAMTLLDLSEAYGLEVIVLGTDISELVLEKARNGVYKPGVLKQIPPYYKEKYLDFVKEGAEYLYKIKSNVKRVVKFTRVNLNRLIDYSISEQDIIFCQNVLIYFQHQQQIKLITELSQRLNVGGLLFLGPGEVVELKVDGLQKLAIDDCLIYQRIK